MRIFNKVIKKKSCVSGAHYYFTSMLSIWSLNGLSIFAVLCVSVFSCISTIFHLFYQLHN